MYTISYLFLFFFGLIMSSYEKPLDIIDIGGTTPINARSIALYKLGLTAVPTDLPGLLLAFGELVEKFGISELENLKSNSLLISRSWIDDVEDIMDAEFNFPSKEDMLQTLLDSSSKNKFLMNIDHRTQYNIGPQKIISKKLQLNSFKFTNIHTLKWVYYLMFCKSNFADKIRNILNTNKITVLEFCSIVGIIHDKISTGIHNYRSVLSGRQIADGLMLNGIDVDRTTVLNYVNFLIGTETPFSDNDSLQEFRLIASISNGFVLGPEIFQSDKFTDAIYLRLTYQPQEIRILSLQESKSDDVSFCTHTDPFLTTALTDLKFSNCSAKECERNPGNPWRSTLTNFEESDDKITIYQKNLYKTRSFKNRIIPVWFDYEGFTKSDYDFDYGFTTEDVASLDDSYRRPMNGMTNKIYVSLTDKNFEHGVDHFKILFLNKTQIGENIAVEQIPETDLFVGSFDPPKNEYFYVEVTTYVNEKTIVSRISSTAVNAAEGFGDDHGNRIFEHRPIFKRQPVSIESYDNYNYVSKIHLFRGLLLVLGVLLLITGLDLAIKLFTPRKIRIVIERYQVRVLRVDRV